MLKDKDTFSYGYTWGSLQGYNPVQCVNLEWPLWRLEVIMRFNEETHVDGLHANDDDVWVGAASALNTQIISKHGNKHIRSFILGEGSLFIMRSRVVLIAWGRTSLLDSVPRVLDALSAVRGEVERVSFMHKSYGLPWEKKRPEISIAEEFGKLKFYFPSSQSFTFGRMSSDYCYLCQYSKTDLTCTAENEAQFSLLMYGVDSEKRSFWFRDRNDPMDSSSVFIRQVRELDNLLDDSWTLHEVELEPSGHGVNAIRDDKYQMFYVVLEGCSSFVSYQTNMCEVNYHECVGNILDAFLPARFTLIALLGSNKSGFEKVYHDLQNVDMKPEFYRKHEMKHQTMYEIGFGQVALKVDYVKKEKEKNEP